MKSIKGPLIKPSRAIEQLGASRFLRFEGRGHAFAKS